MSTTERVDYKCRLETAIAHHEIMLRKARKRIGKQDVPAFQRLGDLEHDLDLFKRTLHIIEASSHIVARSQEHLRFSGEKYLAQEDDSKALQDSINAFLSASLPMEEYLREKRPLTALQVQTISLAITGLQTFLEIWKRRKKSLPLARPNQLSSCSDQPIDRDRA
jgi:hypothetical protein